ncbi:hypothetical protein [Neptuniibacter sp. QD48_11]|uniref:hypothetical protein n=2 Tax=unclassified Neptuniibacter TaxID=2630693 RepID=UPI0039F5EACC
MFFIVFISVLISVIYLVVIYYRKVAECMNSARNSDQIELLEKCMVIPFRDYKGNIADIHLVTLALWGRYKEKGLSDELVELLDETKKVFFLQWVFSVFLVAIPVINKHLTGG